MCVLNLCLVEQCFLYETLPNTAFLSGINFYTQLFFTSNALPARSLFFLLFPPLLSFSARPDLSSVPNLRILAKRNQDQMAGEPQGLLPNVTVV